MSLPTGTPPGPAPPTVTQSIQPANTGTGQTSATGTDKIQLSLTNRLVRWIAFGVFFPFLPIGLDATRHWVILSPLSKVSSVFDKGDWFLISVAIAAAAAGEVIGTRDAFSRLKLCTAAICLGIVTLGTGAFVYVIQSNETTQKYNENLAACFDTKDTKSNNFEVFRDFSDPGVADCIKRNMVHKPEEQLNSSAIKTLSLVFFISALVMGATCMLISEEKS